MHAEDDDDLLVVRADLPTPDMVAVRHENGLITVFVDSTLPDHQVAAFIDELDPQEGTGRALS